MRTPRHRRRLRRGAAALAAAACVAPPSAADPYPQGSLAFFNLGSCPTGWARFERIVNGTLVPMDGFFLVPFNQRPGHQSVPDLVGTTVGTALQPNESRVHQHQWSSSITLPPVAYAGQSGCGEFGSCPAVAQGGPMPFADMTGGSDSGVPYLQLLLCQKVEDQSTPVPPVGTPPAGVPPEIGMLFYNAYCSSGWKPTRVGSDTGSQLLSGRFLVGLPAGGVPLATFGEDRPLFVQVWPDGVALEDRTHAHGFSGAVSVPSVGVGLASGCCAGGYGGAGSFGYSGTTDPASSNLPYMAVTQCQPCVAGDADPACQNGQSQ